jgi:hypothetical protein
VRIRTKQLLLRFILKTKASNFKSIARCPLEVSTRVPSKFEPVISPRRLGCRRQCSFASMT